MTELLQEDMLEPNSGDGLNHIFKIICGPGNHSKNGAQLVNAIPIELDKLDLEYHLIREHGIFLVRLTK